MTQFKHAMEIFQHLNKSNCQQCGKKSCLAFAAAVFQGEKSLNECPELDDEILMKYGSLREGGASDLCETERRNSVIQENREAFLEEMKSKIAETDLEEAAKRTGGKFDGTKLTIRILGKEFSVDQSGNIYTGIHVNPWIAAPVFDYILHGKGVNPSGRWLSFRELKEGRERYPLFKQRCEIPMKQVADSYTELFDNIVSVLNGKEVEQQFQSDISVVMAVLPKVPIMICYFEPGEGLGSNLNIYFDESADSNLNIGSIFSLGAGLTQMLLRMSVTHGAS